MIAKLRHIIQIKHFEIDLLCIGLSIPYVRKSSLGNTYPTRLQKLLKIQKKIVRLMCFKSYTDHSESLFLNLLKNLEYLQN
jgi:hypothetical protein